MRDTPFRVHFADLAEPISCLVSAPTATSARAEALKRHPGRSVAKVKQDRSDRPSKRRA